MLHLCLSLKTAIVCYQWTEAWGGGGGGGGGLVHCKEGL